MGEFIHPLSKKIMKGFIHLRSRKIMRGFIHRGSKKIIRELINDDIFEQILVRLDVKDLIRYKSVCKSWKSLISNPRFGKAHYKFRQVNLIPYPEGTIPDYLLKYGPEYFMVGSSNGLACINSFDGDEIIVANPWTREERMLQNLPVLPVVSCRGFGYDALTDDYKVVFGAMERSGKLAFHVLSLKSNVWKQVGHVTCRCFYDVQIGTLYNGVLRWAVHSGDEIPARLISFDLSTEVLQEIHQRDDATGECTFMAIDKIYGMDKCNVKVHMEDWGSSRGDKFIRPYTCIPTTVMRSLISPNLQEGNE